MHEGVGVCVYGTKTNVKETIVKHYLGAISRAIDRKSRTRSIASGHLQTRLLAAIENALNNSR